MSDSSVSRQPSVAVEPVSGPLHARIRPPGSKSLTNRALIVAALAHGTSRLSGVLDSQDSRVMIESLRGLGILVSHDTDARSAVVAGGGGQVSAHSADLWL